MSKIDTTLWREFKVGDLLSCETTLGIPSKNNLTEGSIPYITRSATDNGYSGTCGNTEKINKGNCITIGAEGFTAFYQKDDFVAGNKIYALRHHEMNEIIGEYLCSILNVLAKSYSFSDARVLEKIKEETILLPVKEEYEPDWQYMEEYMRKILEESEESLENLRKANDRKRLIDVSGWGEFRVGDLFDIHPTKAYKLTNAQLLDDGNYPVIANSAYDNGIGGYSTRKPTEQGNMVTFSDTVDANTIFYQKEPFIGYPHVQGLYPIKYEDKWNELTYQFFVSVLRSTALVKGFDYGNKFRRDIAIELIVKLPITSTGEPDWQYMEEYMRRIMEETDAIIEKYMR